MWLLGVIIWVILRVIRGLSYFGGGGGGEQSFSFGRLAVLKFYFQPFGGFLSAAAAIDVKTLK